MAPGASVSYYVDRSDTISVCSGYYGSVTSSTVYVNGYGDTTNAYWVGAPDVYSSETPEQREKRLAEETALQLKREAANQKAETLLREMFGEEYDVLQKENVVCVDSEKFHGMKYRISKDAHKRIEIVDAAGKIVERLCVATNLDCPDWDVVLTKIMLAKFDEERLQAVANHFSA